MPELIRWFRHLAARLRHVRIINGDWTRLTTSGTTKTLPVRTGDGPCGMFLDPPYADSADRHGGLYAEESGTVAHDVHAWCVEHGADPDYRIVLAGFDGEHSDELLERGWQEHKPFKAGWLKGGYRSSDGTHQMTRDRLWSSPH